MIIRSKVVVLVVAVVLVFSSSCYKISRPAMNSKSRNEAATKGPQKRWTAVAVVGGDGGGLVSVFLSRRVVSLASRFNVLYTEHAHKAQNYDETR